MNDKTPDIRVYECRTDEDYPWAVSLGPFEEPIGMFSERVYAAHFADRLQAAFPELWATTDSETP